MTLEEIESLAEYVERDPSGETELTLVRALLAILPVVKAAEDVRDANPGSPKWAAKMWRLRDATNAMRARMGEK